MQGTVIIVRQDPMQVDVEEAVPGNHPPTKQIGLLGWANYKIRRSFHAAVPCRSDSQRRPLQSGLRQLHASGCSTRVPGGLGFARPVYRRWYSRPQSAQYELCSRAGTALHLLQGLPGVRPSTVTALRFRARSRRHIRHHAESSWRSRSLQVGQILMATLALISSSPRNFAALRASRWVGCGWDLAFPY